MKRVGKWATGGAVALTIVGCVIGSPCRAITAADLDRYKAGVAYQENREWENAIKVFESIVDRSEKTGDISLLIASCYSKMNMPRPAIEELRNGFAAVQSDPSVAKALADRFVTSFREVKSYDNIASVYKYLMSVDRDNAASHANKIAEFYQLGRDWDASISACDDVIARFPRTDAAKVAYMRKGECYQMKEDLDSAIQTYSAFINDFPADEGYAIVQTSICYHKKGDNLGALRMLKKRIGANPGDPAYKSLCAKLAARYFDLGADAEAVTILKAGLKSNAKDIAANRELAKLLASYYLKSEAPGEATSLYYGLIAQEPDQTLSYRSDYAGCLLESGHKDWSFMVMGEALRGADGGFWTKDAIKVFADHVMCKYGIKENAEFLTQAAIDRPDLKDYIISRRAFMRQKYGKDPNEIINDYKELIRSFPQSESVPEWTLEIASRTAYAYADHKEGRRLLNEFLVKYPKDPRVIAAYFTIGTMDYLDKDYVAASAVYAQALNCPEFGNYKALILFHQAQCSKHLADSVKANRSIDRLLGMYPDDCWSAVVLDTFFKRSGGTQN